MHCTARIFFLCLILSQLGCQPLSKYMEQPVPKKTETEQHKSDDLLMKGMTYEALSKPLKKLQCDELKQIYKIQPNWETAWLIVYSLNSDFVCMNLDETLVLLNVMQKTKEVYPQIQWLNSNQIQLLNQIKLLKKLQGKVNRFYKKNSRLKTQLNEAEIQLQQVLAKIQALTAIETNINKKLDDEQSNEH